MVSQRAQPARRKAVSYLETAIRRGLDTGSLRLPPIHSMAFDAGVSPVTLQKAVAGLVQAGKLNSRPRGGTWIVTENNTGAKPEPRFSRGASPIRTLQKWETLCVTIGRDIINGAFGPNDAILPTAKELADRYSVCHRTLNKALHHLASTEVVIPDKRSFRVPGVVTRTEYRGTVVLAATGDPAGNLYLVSPRIEEHLRALEQECSRIGIRLAVCAIAPDTGELSSSGGDTYTPERLLRRADVLGMMVWPLGVESLPFSDLLHRLAVVEKPVAILDEVGVGIPWGPGLSPRHVRTYCIAQNRLAGHSVGRYLLKLGHRRIAYISPTHNNHWSQERLCGLIEMFETVGVEDGVVPITLDASSVEQFVRENSPVTDWARLKLGRPWKGTVSPLLTHPLGRFHYHAATAVNDQALAGSLAPLLEKALHHHDATAWVLANDTGAILTLDFLGRRHVNVPKEISVIGFDDSPDALLSRLTSYSFNGAAAVRTMLDDVVQGMRPFRGFARAGVIVIDGSISVRGTTKSPPNNMRL